MLFRSVKSSESELQTEQQLILDAVAEGVCGVDEEGNATFCNQALLTMTGYSREEMVGRNLHEWLHQTSPEEVKKSVECAFCKVLKDREPAPIVGEFLRRRDGNRLAAEYWAEPLAKPCGRTSFVITVKDVNEIKQAKSALRKGEEKFRRILGSMPDVAWTADRQGRFVYVSPKVEALLGYSKPEICGALRWKIGRAHV